MNSTTILHLIVKILHLINDITMSLCCIGLLLKWDDMISGYLRCNPSNGVYRLVKMILLQIMYGI